MNIIFAGTPEFAAPSLQALIEAGQPLKAVYTQPDRPAGRGRKLTASPVKQLAISAGLPVFQPETLKTSEAQETLRALNPDLMIVVAYGLILPKEVLNIPRLGCVNLHASLLPRWRGAAPIQRAILAGDRETGVTLMQIEPRLDAGPMLAKVTCNIEGTDTAEQLHDKLAQLGARLLMQQLPNVLRQAMPSEPQNEAQVCYAAKLDKAEALIDWSKPAHVLERQVRAFNPWPVAETRMNSEVLRIWRAEALEMSHDAAPGSVLASGNRTLDIICGQGLLRLLEVQKPGGKRLHISDFLNANPVLPGQLG